MKTKKRKKQLRRQQKLQARLAHRGFANANQPLLQGLPITYEIADRMRVLSAGGLGAVHTLVTKLKLPALINERVDVLKRHLPYFESDHILSLCYNLLCGGKPLQDINRLREDEVVLDALGVPRLPAPSTAGDFLRRFGGDAILHTQEAINQARVKIWQHQPPSFFRQAILDIDGTVCPTYAQCAEGIDYCAHKKCWGYGPLLISLAHTQEALYVVNRPASAPSHQGAAGWIERALDLVMPRFETIWLRGDTDFSQTQHLDGWDRRGIQFIFGYDAYPNLVKKADLLPPDAWSILERPPAYEVKTKSRDKPENIKADIVEKRGYKTIKTVAEEVASMIYQPGKCKKPYRLICLKKHLEITQDGAIIDRQIKYFFYITNDEKTPEHQLIHFINQRGNQENTIAQLKSGIPAFHAPSNTLAANWIYMVIAALAWNLKVWYGLLIDDPELKAQVGKMEFKQFLHQFILIPTQIIQQGRKLIYRIVNFTKYTLTFFDCFQNLTRLRFP